MSFVTDIRSVTDSTLDKLADRFDDLPRPLLAAIGAGDFAIEQLAALRESLVEQFGAGTERSGFRATTDDDGEPPQAAGQRITAEVAESIQAFAQELPALAQELVTELPDKLAEFTGDLSVEIVRDTVQAYGQLAGIVYGGLAKRGDRTWSRVRSIGMRPGTVVDAAPASFMKEGHAVEAPSS